MPITPPPGVTRHVDLIDADTKTGTGFHGVGTDYIAKTSRSDQLIARDRMEYPTVDVELLYLAALGKMKHTFYWCDFVTTDSFADLAVEGFIGWYNKTYGLMARYINDDNYYANYIDTDAATADYQLRKEVDGAVTTLATEAVDTFLNSYSKFKLSCSGTTINYYRLDALKATVTDTDLSSGSFGGRHQLIGDYCRGLMLPSGYLRAAGSLTPKVLRFYEIPLIGVGSDPNPFRAQVSEDLKPILEFPSGQLPLELVKEAKKVDMLRAKGFTDEEIELLLGYMPQTQVNLNALTHSCLIRSGADGKPVEYVGLLRVLSSLIVLLI